MPFVNSIRRSFNKSEEQLYKSTASKFKVSGGDKIYSAGGYTIHLFTNSDEPSAFVIDPQDNVPADKMHLLSGGLDAEVLMVGGGGSGGQYSGGGGGGEVLFISRSIAVGSYPTSVAAARGSNQQSWSTDKHGNVTTFLGETARGGGSARGSDDSIPAGNNGTQTDCGTGGGGSSRTAGYFGQQGTSNGSGVTRHGGYRGGQEQSGNDGPYYPGGGGGGSSQSRSGNTGGGGNGQPGGTGTSYSMTGTAYYWAGGGGGQTYYSGQGGAGGAGGGGAGSGGSGGNTGGSGYNNGGSPGSSTSGGAGGANTGGGGGSGNGQNGSSGGGGASGIIIVRYPQ